VTVSAAATCASAKADARKSHKPLCLNVLTSE